MDIQARKLSFIQEFLRITDDKIIDKLELLIKSEKMKKADIEHKPMNINQFQEMINNSLEDSNNGNLIDHKDLKAKINSWK